MKPRPAWLMTAAALGALAAVTVSGVRAQPPQTAGPAQVKDGDSILLAGPGNRQTEIRLYGIDAPELAQTCHGSQTSGEARALPPGEYNCGLRAYYYLRLLTEGLETRCRPIDRDRLDRTVAACETAGRDLAEEMLRAGFAVLYDRYRHLAPALIARYRAAEAEAKAARRGLWAGRFESPEAWRRRRQP
jgi:endonuclease YncB( thermonuclease family)